MDGQNQQSTATLLSFTLNEGARHVLTLNDFGYKITDTQLISVEIAGLPSLGYLRLNNREIDQYAIITRQQIRDGYLVYHAPNDLLPEQGQNHKRTSFIFLPRESSGTSSDTIPLNIFINADDAQATAWSHSNPLTILSEDADTSSSIKITDFQFIDTDGGSPGRLMLSGTHAKLFEIKEVIFDSHQSPRTELHVKQGATFNFETAPILTVMVSIEGTDLSETFMLDVTNVPDITMTEDETYAFKAADFGISVDDVDQQAYIRLIAFGTIDRGALSFGGVRITADHILKGDMIAIISVNDLGNLVLTPSNTRNKDFDFHVEYESYNGNDAKISSGTIYIHIIADDDPATAINLVRNAVLESDPISEISGYADTTSVTWIGNISFVNPDGGDHGHTVLAGQHANLFHINTQNGFELYLNANVNLYEHVGTFLTEELQIRDTDVSKTVNVYVKPLTAAVILGPRASQIPFPDDTMLLEDDRLLYNLGEAQVHTGYIVADNTSGNLNFGRNKDVATTLTTDGAGNRLVIYHGNYGELHVEHDGKWVYTLNDDAAGFDSLDTGQTDCESFNITVIDLGQDNKRGGGDDSRTSVNIAFTIKGRDEDPLTLTLSPGRACLGLNGVEFRANDFGLSQNNWKLDFVAVDNVKGGAQVEFDQGTTTFRFIYKRGISGIFDPSVIASIWNNSPATAALASATIVSVATPDENGWDVNDWTADRGERHKFADGRGNIARVQIGDGNKTSMVGYIEVTNSIGGYVFGNRDDAGVLSIIGAGNTRKIIYQGTYGNLVIDHDGDWIYMLDHTLQATQDHTNSDKQADKYDDFTITVRDAGGNAKSLPISIKVRGGDYRDLPAPASKDDAPDDAPDDAKVLSSFEINSLREVPNVGGTTMAIIFYVMDYADANAALNILFPTDTNARPADFTNDTWGSRIPGFYLFNNAGIASNAPIDNPDTDLSGKDTAYIGNTLPDAEVMLSAAGDQDTYIIQAVFGTSADTSSASVKINDLLLGDTGKNIIYLEAGLMITAASVERPTNNITLTFSNGARLIIVNAEAYFVFQRGENDPLESATIFLSSIGYNALNDSLGNVPHTIVNNSVVTVEFAADTKFEYNGEDDDEEAISISIMVDGGGNIAARQVQFFAATDASGNGRVNIGDKSVETSLILQAAHVGKFIGADVSWTDIKGRKEMVTIYSPTVITDANAAVPEIDAVIGVNSGEGHVLTYRQLDASDDSTDPASLTYTISRGAGLLEMFDGTTWSTLSDGGTFTQADINADKVRILTTADGIFTFTVSDATSPNASPAQTIQVKLRTPADLPPTTVPLEGVDIKAETDPKSVKTGVGETTIELGTGDDEVNPGAADDEVILDKQDGGYDGHDKVIYRFAETGGTESRLVAWDGGDLIKGFTPGEDAIQFGNRNTAADSIDSIDAFLNKLNTDFKVMLDFERKPDASSSSSTSLADYNVTAIKLQFAEAMLLPGGKLAGSIVVIEFKAPIAWTEFKRDWLDGDNQANFEAIFDIDTFSFKNTDAGKAALSDLLWLSFKADTTTRNVAIGGEAADTIDISSESGDWVIQGRGGDDTITLSNGADELVYVFGDDGTSLTTPDGRDTINDFTLGTDSLRFVDDDSDGNDEPLTLDALLGRVNNVVLKYDGTSSSYTGVEITIVSGTSLTINFAAALDTDALKAAFGITTAGTTDLYAAFAGGVAPQSGASGVGLNAVGVTYIDDLFGGTDGIFVSDTIPTELL